jgi:hypothetical protein
MALIHEAEARYQVTELVKKHPGLATLLFKLQWEGANWVTLLKMLQEAIAERPDQPRGEADVPIAASVSIKWACLSFPSACCMDRMWSRNNPLPIGIR